ncbi:Flavanone 7-O-glucoside 2''-O-beta-L-rhamnosyltransferase-like [Heracleum sosnowskyi]|uniref:Flavanone 7-O-glucoside 2''-O-beta-L-rhamnosyltransferase-like n=1 Tax=Heracleum sosnowskyi TaxID=360622 RepID=A0AAD8N5C0_9APIA|nr:Flavanone 7-O-glucoside 2''-O-beta-L-rhamnosyltransferase-like [Heracleum sosnowskyi]
MCSPFVKKSELIMEGENSRMSIVMIPFLAHGHISPFLELAKQLAKRRFSMYLCSTPINLASIKNRIHENDNIQLIELHLPSSPELPPRYHSTNGLPSHLNLILQQALEKAAPLFVNILKDIKPDLVIYDLMPSWPAEVALSLDIPAVYFLVSAAAICCQGLHFYKKADKNLVTVGQLVHNSSETGDNNTRNIMEWLDNKEKSSVVFVCFGSENYLSAEEVIEMAYALEKSKCSFIWALRSPHGEDDGCLLLPEGFVERVGDSGLILKGWAPQTMILGHSSTGCFLSHCGWSSINESMKFGVPIIGMPMKMDQPTNAKLVVEIGVGIEIVRDHEGKFKSGEILKIIRMVLMKESGESLRRKAGELSLKIKEKGEEDLDKAAEELEKLCRKKKEIY